MFMSIVFVSGLAIFGLILLMFPQLRVLLKGFGNIFVKDLASTPDGVRALYEEAIDKAQNSYGKACEHLEIIAGKLKMVEDKLVKANREAELNMNKAISAKKANLMDDAVLFAEEMELRKTEVQTLIVVKKQLEDAKQEAMDMHTASQKNLKELKAKRDLTLTKLEQNASLKEIYAGLDDLRRDSDLDKLIGHVDDKIAKQDEQVAGMKVLHENKLSTKIGKAEERSSVSRAKQFLDSIE